MRSKVAKLTPASGATPRRPTNAVSMSDSKGSKAKAPSAGKARASNCRVIDWDELKDDEEIDVDDGVGADEGV